MSSTNKYCVPKWKQRTADTHAIHIATLPTQVVQRLLIGSSMFERFTTTGAHLIGQSQWQDRQIGIAGVGGDGVQHMLYRVQEGLMEAVCSGKEGDLDTVIIMAGANNVEEKACTPERLAEATALLITNVAAAWRQADGEKREQSRARYIVVLGLTPRTSSKPHKMADDVVLDKIRSTNCLVSEWAASHSVLADENGDDVSVIFFDGFTPFTLRKKGLVKDTSLYEDSVHFNKRGYALFARVICDALDAAAAQRQVQ